MDPAHIEQLIKRFPLVTDLIALNKVSWFNPAITDTEEGLKHVGLSAEDVADASARLARFASYFEAVFPETRGSGGTIESPIAAIPSMQSALSSRCHHPLPGN